MSFFNSIVTCHRNRSLALRIFLQSFGIASAYVDKNSFEIIVVDLGKDDMSPMISTIKQRYGIHIKHIRIPYEGVFWRAKALNCGVLHSEGQYVTLFDCDSFVSSGFLQGVESFFKDYSRTKLCYRLYCLPLDVTKRIYVLGLSEESLKSFIEKRNDFSIFLERYTSNEVCISHPRDVKKEWNGLVMGTSHMTIAKDVFMEIGGFDESFIGWGAEDMDLNRRLFSFLGSGYMETDPNCTVFNMANLYESSIEKKEKDEYFSYLGRNWNQYLKNKQDGVVKLKLGLDWGKF